MRHTPPAGAPEGDLLRSSDRYRAAARTACNRLVAATAAILACATAAPAHHSLAGIYDGTQRVTIEGVVVRFLFVNPHPTLIVAVRDAGGAAHDWRLEMDNRFELEAIGMTAHTLAKGDRVVATGSPAREQRHGLYLRRLDRPRDGFWYEQVGSTPRIR